MYGFKNRLKTCQLGQVWINAESHRIHASVRFRVYAELLSRSRRINLILDDSNNNTHLRDTNPFPSRTIRKLLGKNSQTSGTATTATSNGHGANHFLRFLARSGEIDTCIDKTAEISTYDYCSKASLSTLSITTQGPTKASKYLRSIYSANAYLSSSTTLTSATRSSCQSILCAVNVINHHSTSKIPTKARKHLPIYSTNACISASMTLTTTTRSVPQLCSQTLLSTMLIATLHQSSKQSQHIPANLLGQMYTSLLPWSMKLPAKRTNPPRFCKGNHSNQLHRKILQANEQLILRIEAVSITLRLLRLRNEQWNAPTRIENFDEDCEASVAWCWRWWM